jgi:hypothetical protein
LFSHGSGSAYPPDRSRALLPLNIYFAWTDASQDSKIRAIAGESAQQITIDAVSQGQDIANAPLYGNYAIDTTPVSRIFGGNLAALKALKFIYDPLNVMGLAGGFKVKV